MTNTTESRRFWQALWFKVCAGLLAVVVFLALAIPNVLNAIQRGKRKRTMGDIRSIATAVESYAIDTTAYPFVIGARSEHVTANVGRLANSVEAYAADHVHYPVIPFGTAHEALTSILVPTYLKYVSRGEPWGDHPLEYYYWTDEDGAPHYQIICRGADLFPPTGSGRYEGPGDIVTHCATEDIVLQDSIFLVRAEGRQDQCPPEPR